MRVAVYFNVHKRLFSVKALEGPLRGRVIHHTRHAALHNVKFVVREAGRQRVLSEGRKNVHAFLVGQYEAAESGKPMGLSDAGQCWRVSRGLGMAHVRYNPRLHETFVRDDGTAIHAARCVELAAGAGRPTITVVEEIAHV